MTQHDYSDAEDIVRQIESILPGADTKAVSLLLTATAIRAVDAGISDTGAVSGLIASLKTVRERLARARAH